MKISLYWKADICNPLKQTQQRPVHVWSSCWCYLDQFYDELSSCLNLFANGEPHSVGWVEYKELYSAPPLFPSPRLNILKPNTHTWLGFWASAGQEQQQQQQQHLPSWNSMIVSFENGRNYWQISFHFLHTDVLLLCVSLHVCTLLFPCRLLICLICKVCITVTGI